MTASARPLYRCGVEEAAVIMIKLISTRPALKALSACGLCKMPNCYLHTHSWLHLTHHFIFSNSCVCISGGYPKHRAGGRAQCRPEERERPSAAGAAKQRFEDQTAGTWGIHQIKVQGLYHRPGGQDYPARGAAWTGSEVCNSEKKPINSTFWLNKNHWH